MSQPEKPEKKKMMKKLNLNASIFVPDVSAQQQQVVAAPVQVEQKTDNQTPAVKEPKKPLKYNKNEAESNSSIQANHVPKASKEQVAEIQKPAPTQALQTPVVAETILPATKEPEAPAKLVVNYQLISYFLDRDVVFEVEDDERVAFDKRLISFLNRKYEVNSGKGDFNRSGNKNLTAKPGNTYPRQYNAGNGKPSGSGNSFPTGNMDQIQRNDSKKNTIPAMSKSQSQQQQSTIKRGEEDKDVTNLKMKIKQQSAQFLEQMRSNKLDAFKKQISDIRLDLNILTPTNFEVIKKRLYTLAMSDELLCEYVVEGIIEKARTQKTYSLVYADLCKFMIEESKREFGKEDKSKTFKNHLYTNIQKTFEGEMDIYNNKMSFHKQKNLSDMKSAEERNQYFGDKKKREMLNVKFIGNLFLNKSMSYQILRICCSELLSRFVKGYCEVTDQQKENEEVEEAHYEDHLEALIALFEQTGNKMEEKHKEDKKKNDAKDPSSIVDTSSTVNEIISSMETRKDQQQEVEKLTFDDYFTVLEWLKKNKKVSPRIYSLIINLVERKNESWKDRLSTQTGPVSLNNLHKQHEEEMKQQQINLAKYEQEQKSQKQDRGYNNKKNNNNVRYEQKNRTSQKENSAPGNKYNEKSGITRAKEFWGYLDAKVKLQEDYTVQNAINDFKQFREECDPIVYGEILIKTVYDCNKNHKDDRLQAAKESVGFVKPEQFVQSFNERLNKSKDESSDFPLFLEFLSELFVHVYKQGTIKFSQLKIAYKEGYDEDDQEDLNFVYMSFFEECLNLLKKGENFNVANFIKEEVDPVLLNKDPRYAGWVKDMSK